MSAKNLGFTIILRRTKKEIENLMTEWREENQITFAKGCEIHERELLLAGKIVRSKCNFFSVFPDPRTCRQLMERVMFSSSLGGNAARTHRCRSVGVERLSNIHTKFDERKDTTG